MLQLFELIASSPLAAFLVSAWRDTYYAALILSDCDECGFNDLGKLLFGGLALALLVGITVSLLYRRKREQTSAAAQFVSIRSTKGEE